MKEVFTHWKSLAGDFRKNQLLLLFFDYDGTLTHIVKRPESAKLSAQVKGILKKLLSIGCFKIAIISGRSLKELKRLVGVAGIIYAGNHGMELEGPRLKFVNSKALGLVKLIDRIHKKLTRRLNRFRGVIIEGKGLGISIHYRLHKHSPVEIFKTLKHTIAPYESRKKVKITFGKKVYEIRPNVRWDKGRVVQWLIARYRFMYKNRQMLPIYLGDDLTDEDAFGALRNKGITIFVGSPPAGSCARYHLEDVVAVKRFLNRLIGLKKDYAEIS